MAGAESTAEAVWEGGLADGSGSVTGASEALSAALPVTWGWRTQRDRAHTSPEELIAAAHASCYAMALSHAIGEAGLKPEHLHVTTVVSFTELPEGGFGISESRLRVSGRVPGIDQPRFEELARAGEQGCPVSNALRGNVEIPLEATLEG
jgi:lipoyl-dependent peroxiredoxin